MLAVEVAGLEWLPSALALTGGVVFTVGLALTIWAGWVWDPRAAVFPEVPEADPQDR